MAVAAPVVSSGVPDAAEAAPHPLAPIGAATVVQPTVLMPGGADVVIGAFRDFRALPLRHVACPGDDDASYARNPAPSPSRHTDEDSTVAAVEADARGPPSPFQLPQPPARPSERGDVASTAPPPAVRNPRKRDGLHTVPVSQARNALKIPRSDHRFVCT